MHGLSPDSLAIVLAVGLVLGIRLFHYVMFAGSAGISDQRAALHLVNQLVSPLQLALLLPFARPGGRIFPLPGGVSNSLLSRFGELTLHAIAGWLCLSLPLGILLYLVLSWFFRRRRRARFNELEIPA